ncbi:MAG: hypothetical protein EOO10_25860, partial [Chitinophagaceae bacterium]
MRVLSFFILLGSISFLFTRCANNTPNTPAATEDTLAVDDKAQGPVSVKEEPLSYKVGDQTMKSYMAFDESKQG